MDNTKQRKIYYNAMERVVLNEIVVGRCIMINVSIEWGCGLHRTRLQNQQKNRIFKKNKENKVLK